MARFFDSSALVKRYVAEVGSGWVQALTAPTANHLFHVVRVTGAETVAAIVRHVPALPAAVLAQAVADFRQDFVQQYQIIGATAALIDMAMGLAVEHRLRGYDAIQLAGGIQLHQGMRAASGPLPTFVSADSKLNAAATAEGFVVDNPNQHP